MCDIYFPSGDPGLEPLHISPASPIQPQLGLSLSPSLSLGLGSEAEGMSVELPFPLHKNNNTGSVQVSLARPRGYSGPSAQASAALPGCILIV